MHDVLRRNNGIANEPVSVIALSAKDKPKIDGYIVDPADNIAVNETFTVTVVGGEKFDTESLIEISNSGGTESNELHTSCSVPLIVGDRYGSLTIVALNELTGDGSSEVSYQYGKLSAPNP